jgi:hypothetical protein
MLAAKTTFNYWTGGNVIIILVNYTTSENVITTFNYWTGGNVIIILVNYTTSENVITTLNYWTGEKVIMTLVKYTTGEKVITTLNYWTGENVITTFVNYTTGGNVITTFTASDQATRTWQHSWLPQYAVTHFSDRALFPGRSAKKPTNASTADVVVSGNLPMSQNYTYAPRHSASCTKREWIRSVCENSFYKLSGVVRRGTEGGGVDVEKFEIRNVWSVYCGWESRFQHDGASTKFRRAVRNPLDTAFGDNWIASGGIVRPPLSPHMAAIDFFCDWFIPLEPPEVTRPLLIQRRIW